MDDGWDLHAVVKSCATTSSTLDTSVEMDRNEDKELERIRNESDHELVSNSKFGETNINMCGGDDQWLAATVGATTSTITSGTSISFGGGTFGDEEPASISFSFGPDDSSQPVQDSKWKKKKKKRVVELREDELSSDGWAWRKYGQKPIKGSSHPRNYYRCSTTKDCSARKQVEKSPTDTNNYIVSYTGNHLHPRPTHLSSLAGTTRITNKPATALPDQQLPRLSSSSPRSTSSFSPTDDSFKEDDTKMNDDDIDELIKNY